MDRDLVSAHGKMVALVASVLQASGVTTTDEFARLLKVFADTVGETDAEELRAMLLSAARDVEAVLGVANEYGQRYVVDFDFFRQGRAVRIRSTWIVRSEDGLPRLTSCYVL